MPVVYERVMILSKKPLPPAVDYESTLGPELLSFLERIEYYELKVKSINLETDVKELEWSSTLSEAKRSLNRAKEEVNELKERTSTLKKIFISLVHQLKLGINTEDFEKLKNNLSDWPLEKFITINEFEEMVKDSF